MGYINPGDIQAKDITEKVVFDILYEYARKAGLDDEKAIEVAEEVKGTLYRSVSRRGGDTYLIPEDGDE